MAQVLCDLGLAHAQALARRDHQHNRDDAPGNAEHGERGTQLVRPQSLEDIANEVAENHEMAARALDAGPAKELYASRVGAVQGKRSGTHAGRILNLSGLPGRFTFRSQSIR